MKIKNKIWNIKGIKENNNIYKYLCETKNMFTWSEKLFITYKECILY